MGTFYGFWACNYCGRENSGKDRECKGCGHPRDANTKFYPVSRGDSKKPREYITDYKFEHLATQPVVGDHNILLGFAGDNTSLLSIAIPFAHEEFEAIDEDSYDSVCEFINTINGLYASKSSYAGISIDMEPPLFYDNGNITSQKIYKLPMTISQKSVDLIVIIDTDYSIN